MSSYYESAEEIVITHDRAIKELNNHGLDDSLTINDFYNELGVLKTYDAQQVLRFIGY
jgi:hypothetical protein|tara:strand:- start:95 stop:268 length:174 start_codon:yes stop_codon:yes gene_type:complete